MAVAVIVRVPERWYVWNAFVAVFVPCGCVAAESGCCGGFLVLVLYVCPCLGFVPCFVCVCVCVLYWVCPILCVCYMMYTH